MNDSWSVRAAHTKLLAIARRIVANSTSQDAKNFDVENWLDEWLDSPQPALGGRKTAELLKKPSGFEQVARLLGAMESGAYQ